MKRYFVLLGLLLCCSLAFADGIVGVSGSLSISNSNGIFSTSFADASTLNLSNISGFNVTGDPATGLVTFTTFQFESDFPATTITLTLNTSPLNCGPDIRADWGVTCSISGEVATLETQDHNLRGAGFAAAIGAPEPASFVLLGFGLLGIRKRRT